MWTIASQPIQKIYNSRMLSRSFLLSTICCVFSFVIPILILISIGYSWSQYESVLLPISITYENSQSTCLLADGSTIYDSTFATEISGSRSYQSFVSVGTDQSKLTVSATITATNVVACSFLVYLRAKINNKYENINVLPISFHKTSSLGSTNLVQVSQSGSIYVKIASAIPQSSIGSSIMTGYYTNDSQTLAMTDTHLKYNSVKNLSFFAQIQQNLDTYSSTPSTLSYIGIFEVPAQIFLQETSLLTNFRKFIPYYIYLFILIWIFVAKPTVRWMLENKIYKSKSQKPKIKIQ